jgi:twitching motility protein PilT
MMDIGDILEEAVRRNASDILISAGAPITYHVYGVLHAQDPDHRLDPKETETLVYQLLNQDQRKTYEQQWDLDLGFQYRDIARFRVNAFFQRGTAAAVLRLVPLTVPDYTQLGIAERLLMQMVNTMSGLILVTGPTGAGKSSTVASFLEYLNNRTDFPRHIITIEDPIEFLLPSKACVIDQRELGADTHDYPIGIRSALRQMPHIIFVGEMRDRPTMEIALTAAETGNLVISTLSTQSASKTINRIIDVFPLEDQAEIRTRLALTLKIIVSQVLLRRADAPGRIAAREILLMNSSISNLIREGKLHQINNVIASSLADGMVLMDDSLLELHSQGVIRTADAALRMQDPERIKTLMRTV